MASQGQWLRAVLEWRAAYARDPTDAEVKSMLRQYELDAAEYYYRSASKDFAQGQTEAGIIKLEQGLTAMPGHEKLQAALEEALAKREADKLLRRARRNIETRNYRQAREQLNQAISIWPAHSDARSLLQEIRQHQKGKSALSLNSKSPITLNFKETELRMAFGFLAKSFGINVIFDEAVKDKRVTLFARDVTFKEALGLMIATTRTFYKVVNQNTILIAPDTKDKRGQYEEYLIRTFHLNNTSAKEMADIIKGAVSLQKVVVNERLNTLTIRDTEQVLNLVSQLVEINDAKPAEMILEVEILEVNRTKAEQLGFDFGSAFTATFPKVGITGSFREALKSGEVTLPAFAFRYFKQNVEAKTLANPKIRVIDGKPAKIHIGDRVPLRSATVTDPSGQSTTNFEYTDIGIRLLVTPEIYLDNSTLVQLGLEVSSLGQNLGTQADPAFSIGTRNAETFMLLNDGETAILGGLIRDEDRKTRVKVPGLGDIPLVGAIFTAKDDSDVRTDVLLTITPRIIRPWKIMAEEKQLLPSGTAERYAFSGDMAKPGRNLSEWVRSVSKGAPRVEARRESQIVAPGEEITIDLLGSRLGQAKRIPLEVAFDSRIIHFVGWTAPEEGAQAIIQPGKDGTVNLAIISNERPDDAQRPLGALVFEAYSKGATQVVIGGNVELANGSSRELSGEIARVMVR